MNMVEKGCMRAMIPPVFTVAFAAFVCLSAEGKVITPAEALDRCYGIEESDANGILPKFNHEEITSVIYVNGTPCAYVFSNETNGYAVVNADSRGEAFLGYGDSVLEKDADLPPAMIWWIEQYANEIRNLPETPVYGEVDENRNDAWPSIEPLCTSRWGQGHPYNMFCPEIDGQKTWSGCVATSMAQIMYHFQWPLYGRGSHSYFWNNQEISADFSSMEFNWNDMLDSYMDNETYSLQQAEAVGLLNYACGVAVDMNYGLDGSGAEGEYQAEALMKYFDYGKCTTLLERKDFYTKDWESLMYSSLKAGAPVAYMGNASGGGHAFLLDGYENDGFFHFNWGWTGDANGYFRLSSINPYQEEFPGYIYGYNRSQKAVVFAIPGNVRDTPLVVMSNRTSLSGSVATDSSVLTLKGDFMYYGNAATVVRAGVEVSNVSGESWIIEGSALTLESQSHVAEISVGLPELPVGAYSLTPVYHDGDEWQSISTFVGNPKSVVMTVGEDNIYFDTIEKSPLVLADMKYNTPFYMGYPFEIEFEIRNDNTFEQYIKYYVVFLNLNGELIWNYNPELLFFNAGETKKVVSQNLLPFFSSLGEYKVGIAYKDGDDIEYVGEPETFILELVPDGFNFEGTGLKISQLSGTDDEYVVDYGIRSLQGFYCYKPRIAVADSDGNILIRKEMGPYCDFVLDGESSGFSRNVNLPGLQDGEYIVRLYASVTMHSAGSDDDSYMPFLGEARLSVERSGVDNVEDDLDRIYVENGKFQGLEGCRIYNMQGIEQTGTNLLPGIYVVCHKSIVKKIRIL